MNPNRILHVAAPGVIGGLERVLATLAAAQQASGAEVHVAAFLGASADPASDRLLSPLRSAGVSVHPFALPGRAYRRERDAVADLARRHRIDIIHTHGYRADVVDGGVARRLRGVAAVTTVHGFTGGGLRNRCYEWLQRRSFRRFDAVVGVSRKLAEQLLRSGVFPERVHTVKNSWQPSGPRLDRAGARGILGVAERAFVVGWVGRMSREKGADVLLDALQFLEDVPLCVQMIGDGPERCALQSMADQRWPPGRVEWRGIIPDADRLFHGFDAFVNSSRTEGTPMVLFEAMAAGVPIVATRVGGVPDMIDPEEALLVDPGRPEDLAAAVRDIARNPAAACARAGAARLRIERDSGISKWVTAYNGVYQSAMAVARTRQ